MSKLPDDAAFATRVVHAGLDPDPHYGSVIPAIHQTSTYAQSAPGAFVEEYDYSRSANPTRAALELALGALEGGLGSAFSSGMAATHALITVVAEAGGHIVIPSDLYGGTYRLVDKVLTRWGLEYTMVDQTDLDALAGAVRDDTKLIWVETPTNPLLNVVDIEGVVALQGRRARRRRQHVRDAGQPAPARARRRRGRPLDDEVPGRTQRHGRRRGRRQRSRAARARALRPERRRRGAGPDGLLPRASRPAHAAPAHARARRERRRGQRRSCAASRARPTSAGPASAAWSPSATPTPCGSRARRRSSRSPSRSAASSRSIEVPQAMTHQSVEGSDAAVPADLVRLSCGIEAARGPRRGPAPRDRLTRTRLRQP